MTISKNFNARWIPFGEEDDDDDGIVRRVLLFYFIHVSNYLFLSFFLSFDVCLSLCSLSTSVRFQSVFVDFRTFFLNRKSFFFLFFFSFFTFFIHVERRTRVFVRTLSITFFIRVFCDARRNANDRACIARPLSVRFREKKNRGRVFLLSRKKKDRRADFF